MLNKSFGPARKFAGMAIAAGLTLGVLIEWATIPEGLSNWKFGVGFVVLILALIIRPQGVFGKAKTVG